MTFAAGLATEGYKPFAAIYSTFLQRAYDQVVHDVAIQSLPVRFAIDRAGLVGADGPTHAGSLRRRLSRLPAGLRADGGGRRGRARAHGGDRRSRSTTGPSPCAIRAARARRGDAGGRRAAGDRQGPHHARRQQGRAAVVRHAPGECLKAAEELAALGLSTTVADARFAKPLDVDLIQRLAREHEVLITIEEGSIGGFGAYVLQSLAEHGVLDRGLKVRAMVLPDVFIDQDKPETMYAKAGLDAKGIVAKVFEALGKDAPPDGSWRSLRHAPRGPAQSGHDGRRPVL